MIAGFRAVFKFVGFLAITARGLIDFRSSTARGGATLQTRTAWCNRQALRYLRLLNVEVTVRGTPPNGGLLTCNHLSYLDIVVLSGIHRQVFLSKAEVKSWPIIGWLTRCAGTLFVRRDRKADVADLQSQIHDVVAQGIPLTIFPEGTSSDGSTVLPFRSSFLEPAAQNNWPVTPAWIGYRLDEGSVADEVCYWRDMTFAPHFFKLLSKKKIYVTVVFGEPIESGLSRKQMAAVLHREVMKLAAQSPERPVAIPTFGGEEFAPTFNS
jgi:1-acyl-sn-glycerol-3-phosphate acyltransferase